MPTLTPTLYGDLNAPQRATADPDRFPGGRHGYESTGGAAAPLADPTPLPAFYHLPTLPRLGVGHAAVASQGSAGMLDGRTVDPGYGYWNTHAPFMAQGHYDGVPVQTSMPVTGRGTPNVHAQTLLQGVQTLLAQYNPDPYTYSAAYVGALAPQAIAVGQGGVRA